MNRRRTKKTPYWIAGVCAFALVAWVVLMVVIFRDDDLKNNKNNTDNKTEHKNDITETPGATPTIAVPEGSVLVWRVAECMKRNDDEMVGTRTEYQYNELGQCVGAMRYDRTGAMSELWKFQYSMTKSKTTGKEVPQTIVTMVENPNSGEDKIKYAMINTYEDGRPMIEMTGETTDAEELADFRPNKRVEYEYEENGDCKDIRTYLTLNAANLKLSKREFAIVREDTPEVREWWEERYLGGNIYERWAEFSDSCGVFFRHGCVKNNSDEGIFDFRVMKKVKDDNTVVYNLVEFNNGYTQSDRVAESVEVTERDDGTRQYVYTHYYFDNTSDLASVAECDSNGRRIMEEFYDRSFVSQKIWEYDDSGRLTKWYVYCETLEYYEGGCEVVYNQDGHVLLKRVINGRGEWETVYTASFDSRGNMTQRVVGDKSEAFSYEYDEFGNLTGFRYKSPSENFQEVMTYTPIVITEEQAREAEKYYFPSCTVQPTAEQDYEEPVMD